MILYLNSQPNACPVKQHVPITLRYHMCLVSNQHAHSTDVSPFICIFQAMVSVIDCAQLKTAEQRFRHTFSSKVLGLSGMRQCGDRSALVSLSALPPRTQDSTPGMVRSIANLPPTCAHVHHDRLLAKANTGLVTLVALEGTGRKPARSLQSAS